MDILIDPTTNDVVFNNGFVYVTSDLKTNVAQALKIALQTFAGEWFLDVAVGLPYFQQIFGKVRNKSTVDSIFQTEILKNQNVSRILSFSSTLDNTRQYSITFTVECIDNSITNPIVIGPIGV